MNTMLTAVLERMLRVKRPHTGKGEGAALAWLHRSVVPFEAKTWIDGIGNLHIDLREHGGNRTLFIAHVDTMHRVDGDNDFTLKDGVYAAKGDVLGADDGAGVAILSVLMQSIPAYYIFCRGEERGGVGSRYLAKEYPEVLSQFDRAIAFDRRGFSDVITHQFCGRCCSDNFAEALSDQLNDQGLLYMPCDTGVFTDTANFVDLIPECTNISCGYDFEHSDREHLDANYLQSLCDAALKVNWDALPVSREPGDNGDYDAVDYAFETGLPIAYSDLDTEIESACYAALEGEPDELMDLVGRQLSTSGWRLDDSLFQRDEVMAVVSYCHTWEEFLNYMADESAVMVN